MRRASPTFEVMVSNARVIEKENLAADTVHIGSSVFVKTKRADGSEAERSFSIVGSNEANPRQGKISDESAVGKALCRREGRTDR